MGNDGPPKTRKPKLKIFALTREYSKCQAEDEKTSSPGSKFSRVVWESSEASISLSCVCFFSTTRAEEKKQK